ncbi:PhoX family phosphatase [Streptomyces sp. OF3]|uniref:PhoX family phosphatase n=1 Tax=Streptomyces alkaliterrae TaxID=2213162 RepID=A0A7W3WP43_9ACTN|nr:PhoX family phosphatase [Streptomyces alkaliterrae]MBB1255876.1 PhoX family phosphatase [Streptomyces alkaliterrae]
MSEQRPELTRTDPDDISSNPSDNRPFGSVLDARLSRRGALRGGTAAAAGFVLLGGPANGTATARPVAAAPPTGGGHHRELLGFRQVDTHDEDVLTVPEGYCTQVLIPWGTPIQPGGPRWRKDASNTAADQARQLGMNHDGMHFFPLGKGRHASSRRGLLVLNHEYVDQQLLFPDGEEDMTPEKVAKALAAHGVSIVEIECGADGRWHTVRSRLARKVTGSTPVTFSGPVAEQHPELRARNRPMGTLNNCSMGVTPWGTYLTCEENFNSYFGTEDPDWRPNAVERRYGINSEGFGYGWHRASERFDIAVNPKEANRFGWVVEIDPKDPAAVPVKRTALGRIKHEGCVTTVSRGRIVGYTGDDQDGDYVYKFVGDRPWRDHLDRGRSPLDHGTLYVARFDDDGTGTWLPLVFGRGPLTRRNGWRDQADVLLRTRMAADALGATPMDRPEWLAVHPKSRDVYVSLTNGSGRGGAANPRQPNPYGHIVRWREHGGDNTATRFEWEVFVLAGDPAHDDRVELGDNMFGSPDGLWFDPDGRLWIQTDVSNSSQNLPEKGYENIGNNAMLAADPDTGEIRRFLVGPRGCEITGVVTTPDQRTMFVNVQHPGEETPAWGTPTPENPRAVSNWPDHDPEGRPRSATVVIWREDGGKVGAP